LPYQVKADESRPESQSEKYYKSLLRQAERGMIPENSKKNEAEHAEINVAGIEEKLLSRDVAGAKAIIEKTRWNAPLRAESESVIECVENILWFYTYLNQKKDIDGAIATYSPMMRSYNGLPEEIPFSVKLVKVINDSIDGAEKFINKECGNDFGKIKVGMKLDQVQKCVAEFYLRGQLKTKDGVVDHYTRGDSYLYIKKGRVVAWGD
jgi:hypothetical protein